MQEDLARPCCRDRGAAAAADAGDDDDEDDEDEDEDDDDDGPCWQRRPVNGGSQIHRLPVAVTTQTPAL